MKGKFFESFFGKKRYIIICAVVLVLVIVLCIFVFGDSTKRKKVELENELKSLGKDFYENFYYDLVVNSNGVESIKKYETTGIKVDLDNLSRQNNENKEKVKDFVNDKNEECSKTNTKVIIYPKDPYGKTNYELQIQLDCGFEK